MPKPFPMTHRIETLAPKTLAGLRLPMSLADFRPQELWRRFIPRRGELRHVVGQSLFSASVYPAGYFDDFQPGRSFEQWAAAEVSRPDDLPAGMEVLLLPAGLHAVFPHTGRHDDSSIFQRIYQQWLPASGFLLDQRPHFEVLAPGYRRDDPQAQEEIWIPIRHMPKA